MLVFQAKGGGGGWVGQTARRACMHRYRNGSHRSFGASRDAVFMTINELLDTLEDDDGAGDGMYLYDLSLPKSVAGKSVPCLELSL